MASIRSKILRGSALVSFIFLFSACSEKATCALEGCTEDSGVKLQSDSQGSEDARPDDLAAAKAEIEKAKKALEDAFAELKDRVIFNESVDKIQNDMLHIHETRIAALELKANTFAEDISGLKSRMTTVEGEIANVRDELFQAEERLMTAIAEGDQATIDLLQPQVTSLKNSHDALKADYDIRVKALEELTDLQDGALVGLINSSVAAVQGQVTKLIQALYGSSGTLPESMPAQGVLARLSLIEQGAAQTNANLLNLFHLVVKMNVALGVAIDFKGTLDASKWEVSYPEIQQMKEDIAALQGVVGDSESGLVKALALLQDEVDGITRCSVSAEYYDGKLLNLLKVYKKDVSCTDEGGTTSKATVIVRIGT